eukprot:scaffold184829_cov30-Tisochrysis_lutea.AAC.4
MSHPRVNMRRTIEASSPKNKKGRCGSYGTSATKADGAKENPAAQNEDGRGATGWRDSSRARKRSILSDVPKAGMVAGWGHVAHMLPPKYGWATSPSNRRRQSYAGTPHRAPSSTSGICDPVDRPSSPRLALPFWLPWEELICVTESAEGRAVQSAGGGSEGKSDLTGRSGGAGPSPSIENHVVIAHLDLRVERTSCSISERKRSSRPAMGSTTKEGSLSGACRSSTDANEASWGGG